MRLVATFLLLVAATSVCATVDFRRRMSIRADKHDFHPNTLAAFLVREKDAGGHDWIIAEKRKDDGVTLKDEVIDSIKTKEETVTTDTMTLDNTIRTTNAALTPALVKKTAKNLKALFALPYTAWDQANWFDDTDKKGVKTRVLPTPALKTATFRFTNGATIKVTHDSTMHSALRVPCLNGIIEGLSELKAHGIQPHKRTDGGLVDVNIHLFRFKNSYMVNNGQFMANLNAHKESVANHGSVRSIFFTPFMMPFKTTDHQVEDKLIGTMRDGVTPKYSYKTLKLPNAVADKVVAHKRTTHPRTTQQQLWTLRAKYTLIHEMGHVLHSINNEALFFETKASSVSLTLKQESGPHQNSLGVLSPYSVSVGNPHEWFAEMFTHAVAVANGDLPHFTFSHDMVECYKALGGDNVFPLP